MQLMRLRRSDTGFLVKCDELADCPREPSSLRLAKRILASDILKARHEDRETKRVESRIIEGKRVRQRRQRLVLVYSNRLDFSQNGVSQGHCRLSRWLNRAQTFTARRTCMGIQQIRRQNHTQFQSPTRGAQPG